MIGSTSSVDCAVQMCVTVLRLWENILTATFASHNILAQAAMIAERRFDDRLQSKNPQRGSELLVWETGTGQRPRKCDVRHRFPRGSADRRVFRPSHTVQVASEVAVARHYLKQIEIRYVSSCLCSICCLLITLDVQRSHRYCYCRKVLETRFALCWKSYRYDTSGSLGQL